MQLKKSIIIILIFILLGCKQRTLQTYRVVPVYFQKESTSDIINDSEMRSLIDSLRKVNSELAQEGYNITIYYTKKFEAFYSNIQFFSYDSDVIKKIEEFKKKEKFVEDNSTFYPGITDSALRTIMTKKINVTAEDFKNLAKKVAVTEKEYQNIIKIGLQRFSDTYVDLDTEDRERVCMYFEELMDIVGLESSDGLLNNFMYGFNPTE